MPIELPRLDPCPYCEAFAGRLVYPAAARTADTAVLVTAEQRGDPHVLVVPTRHVPTVLGLYEREAAVLFATVARVARAVALCYDVEGIAVWQSNGVSAYQSVPQVHVHVAGTLPPPGTRFGPVDPLGSSSANASQTVLLGHCPKPTVAVADAARVRPVQSGDDLCSERKPAPG